MTFRIPGMALVVALATIAPAVAQRAAVPSTNQRVDQLVALEMRQHHTPGVSIAVLRKGVLIRERGYGFANLEHRVPAGPETIYQSGSVGKQFTATLVMMLVEQHRIALDDHISQYLSEAPPAWKDITVRHLLTHTAGISERLYAQIDLRKDYTEAELLGLIAAMPLDFPPGERMRYSNPGYILLGILVHRVTGTFYGDLLQQWIFAPLGMHTARIIDEAAIIPHRAAGYRLVDTVLRNQEWVSPSLNTTADGSIYLTVRDLAKWDAALGTERLLKRASLEQMWTPMTLNDGTRSQYGFAWFLDSLGGHRIVEHSGQWQGFTSHVLRSLDDGLTVVVLTNSAQGGATGIAHGIAAIYNPALARDAIRNVAVDTTTLNAIAGDYELRPGFILHVTRAGDTLYTQADGQDRVRLFAESPTMFAVKEFAAKLEFVRDSTGAVTHAILHQNGAHEARKVK